LRPKNKSKVQNIDLIQSGFTSTCFFPSNSWIKNANLVVLDSEPSIVHVTLTFKSMTLKMLSVLDGSGIESLR